MMLVNGLFCLAAAVVLLIQLSRSNDIDMSQLLKKIIWIHWSLLMILAIHHICNNLLDPWMNQFINMLDPLADTLNGGIGLLIAYYLSQKRTQTVSTT